jgi:MarR family transcriptional regulator, 2-MHQ and catechol-resistance regulon repressor
MSPTHYKGTKEQELALDTFIKLTRSVNSLESRIAGHDLTEGLTPSQFGVLETLLHLGPLCPGELSGKLLKSTGNMTLVLDNLEKRGLVRRVRETGDRRQIHINLTPKGDALIRRIFPSQAQAITQELSALSAEEQQQLGALCRKLGKKA